MVILTMTIERMCIVWDERGVSEALTSGIGSLVAAVICYWAMSIEELQFAIQRLQEVYQITIPNNLKLTILLIDQTIPGEPDVGSTWLPSWYCDS